MKNIKTLDSIKDNEQYIILEEYPEIEYTIMKRDTKFQPWMAVWQLDKETGTWSNGHYFERLTDAVAFVEWKKKGVYRDKIEEIATQLISFINDSEDYELDEVLDDYGIELDVSEKMFFGLGD